MAHVMKAKAGAVAGLTAHYGREAEVARGYVRGNVDPSRTPLNYAVGADCPEALVSDVRERVSEAVRGHERASGKALRKDANVLMDWVVTRPQDCPEGLTEAFFEAVVAFVRGRYGEENVPGGFVHMDETTPHVHIPVIPVRDGRLQASKVVNRHDLQTFHADLGRAVDAALGVHVSIELDESRQGDKQLSRLSQREYVAAKGELARVQEQTRAAQDRLESLQREVEVAERGVADLEGRVEAARGHVERLAERLLAVGETVVDGVRGALADLLRALGFEVGDALPAVDLPSRGFDLASELADARAVSALADLGGRGARTSLDEAR